MSKQKIYCGNARIIETRYGDLMKLSFSAEDLQKLQDNLDRGWVNAVVKERREPSASGTTHYLEIDEWKAEPPQEAAKRSSINPVDFAEQQGFTFDEDDEIPF